MCSSREESDTEVTDAIPALVSIELVPLSLSSWQHVQSKALNPRLRYVCIHKFKYSSNFFLYSIWLVSL